MWIAIVYLCTAANCFFVDVPPTYTKDGCKENERAIRALLNADNEVLLFDVTCIHVQMTQS